MTATTCIIGIDPSTRLGAAIALFDGEVIAFEKWVDPKGSYTHQVSRIHALNKTLAENGIYKQGVTLQLVYERISTGRPLAVAALNKSIGLWLFLAPTEPLSVKWAEWKQFHHLPISRQNEEDYKRDSIQAALALLEQGEVVDRTGKLKECLLAGQDDIAEALLIAVWGEMELGRLASEADKAAREKEELKQARKAEKAKARKEKKHAN